MSHPENMTRLSAAAINCPDFAAWPASCQMKPGGYIYDIDQKDKRTENLSLVLNSGNIFAVNNELGKKLGELFSE